jgi:hypothetical protein
VNKDTGSIWGRTMGKSIIEDIVEDEKKKKQLALKRKRERIKKQKELERQKREKELELERQKRERELQLERWKQEQQRLEQQRLELEKKKLEEKKKDRIPVFRRKIEESLQAQTAPQGHDSLPVGFISEKKNDQTTEELSQPSPESQPPQDQPPQQQPPAFPIADEGSPQQPSPPVMRGPPQKPVTDQLADIRQLIDIGTKEELHNYFQSAIRSGKVVYLPGINPSKFKFSDYGYRRLIEHIIEDKNFLNIIVDTETMQGVTFVTISDLIRPKDDPNDLNDDKVIPAELTLRGLEGLCEALYNESAELDPYENEWKHLNKLLECFTQPEIKGKVRLWRIETEKNKYKVTAVNKNNTWIYRVIKGK